MKLQKLTIQNFKCFEESTIAFHPRLTLIVGNNAAGKTTVLDAASIAIGTFFTGFDGIAHSNIPQEAVYHKCFDMGSVIDLQAQYPVVIEAQGTLDGREISWKRTLDGENGRTTVVGAKKLTARAEDDQRRIRSGDKSVILPLLCYYGTGRLWAQKKSKKGMDELWRFSRTSGYVDALDAASNEKMMLKWFQKMTIQEATKGENFPELKAVKDAMLQCFQGGSGTVAKDVEFNPDTGGLDLIYGDRSGESQRVPMSELSDGYKNTLSMVADMAYRMAVLNPQLLSHTLTETPGIVLIDEIDQHLHPAWQQRVIADLMNIFPNIQFILTTHAPAVINSVTREHLVILRDGQMLSPSFESYGRDVNSILLEIMGVPERPAEIKALFQQFYDLLDQQQVAQAEQLLRTIIGKIGEDDPEVASAQVTLDLERH